MLVEISHGTVSFGADTILSDINFIIKNTEKIAIIGRNGCGKTTLLNLIFGRIGLDRQDSDQDVFIARRGGVTIGYLQQNAFEDDSVTLEEEIKKAFQKILDAQGRLDELLERMENDATEEIVQEYVDLQAQFQNMGGYEYEKEYELLIQKFGFTEDDRKKKLSEFSGGQRTRIAFAKMLLSKPDVLLLDEPTNHLDIGTIRWLEQYLKTYERALVVVSHDRMFLDNVVSVVYEIEGKHITMYSGNYSSFVIQKRQNYDKRQKEYEAQQNEIARLEKLIDHFKGHPTKAPMARAKRSQLERMERILPPVRYDLKTFHPEFEPAKESYTDVLTVKKLQIGYNRKLAEVSLEQKKGEKIGVIGDNGCGKSTLLRTLIGQAAPLGGTFSFGGNIEIGYFEQQMAQYNSTDDVLTDFCRAFPAFTNHEVRNALGAFLFSEDDVYKNIRILSGGEKVRLALCKIMSRKPNFLILDEPTNHMDILSKEVLGHMLKNYSGTVLFVSHDRYFIKQVADALLIFKNGVTQYISDGYEQMENGGK